MKARTTLFVCVTAALGTAGQAQSFHEQWETAMVKVCIPSDFCIMPADAGYWSVHDSITGFPQCGPTPQRAEITMLDGNRILRLKSQDSGSECSDNVWITMGPFGPYNQDFAVPITLGTTISFDETGWLTDPQLHGSGQDCLLPPCFDNVSLVLTDNNENVLAYVLQRYPDANENTYNANFGDTYREIFLDPDAGRYERDLYRDFRTIPAFTGPGAQVRSIEFRVDEHGWAMLDNLAIDPGAPVGTVPVHRFWSPARKCHFYTASESERQKLIDNYSGLWRYEGPAYYALADRSEPNALPVYRFWSSVLKAHFYTIEESEKNKLITRFPDVWTYERIAFYAYPAGRQPAKSAVVYRFWSNVLACHFYTTSEGEKDKLIDQYSHVWTFEGTAWYAYTP